MCANSKDKNKGLGNRYSLGDFSYNKEKDGIYLSLRERISQKAKQNPNK